MARVWGPDRADVKADDARIEEIRRLADAEARVEALAEAIEVTS